jgi:hypothetical protein
MKSNLAAVRLELIKSGKIISAITIFTCCDRLRESEILEHAFTRVIYELHIITRSLKYDYVL